MATTTPNYLWVVPTSSDLVKNGATAIETLGDSVDASLWNSGYGQAGKNKIINADFGIWQRGTTFTNPTLGTYTADRFVQGFSDANPTSASTTRQTFSPGAAPLAGYDGLHYARSTITTVGSNTVYRPFTQRIEEVKTFAGQTVTISFFAKADSARTLSFAYSQNFGSGGSTAVSSGTTSFTLSNAWQRFSVTQSIPSISGKTVGTSSYLEMIFTQASASGSVLDFWGLQVEYGTYATPFQTASGNSIEGELALCQRYYHRAIVSAVGQRLSLGHNSSTTASEMLLFFPVAMRTSPTALEQSGTAADYTVRSAGGNVTCSVVPVFANATTNIGSVTFEVASGLVLGLGSFCRAASTNAYLGWSAEL